MEMTFSGKVNRDISQVDVMVGVEVGRNTKKNSTGLFTAGAEPLEPQVSGFQKFPGPALPTST